MTNLSVEKEISQASQPVMDEQGNASSLTLSTDKIGIGTKEPTQQLTLGSGNIFLPNANAGVDGNLYFGGVTDTGQVGMRLFGGKILDWQSGFIDVKAGTPGDGLIFRVDTEFGGREQMRINASGNVGLGVTQPQEKLHVAGNILATGDIRLANADCAEDFDIVDADQVEPGSVMVLGEGGKLSQSRLAYDKCVAGVISGAGDYKPGIVLDKQHAGQGRKPIGLVGKVYCKVDATYGAIDFGDLLTTSPTCGHAMKAGDPVKAFGAVLGKALRSLSEGQSLIPILIALQ